MHRPRKGANTDEVSPDLIEIEIMAYSFISALGQDPELILKTEQQGQSAPVKEVRSRAQKSPLYGQRIPTLPIAEVEGKDPLERTLQLLSANLELVLKKIPASVDHRRVLIYILLPAPAMARSHQIQADNLWEAIDSLGAKVRFMPRCFATIERSPAEHFLVACDFLVQKECDLIIFGGVDSLIHRQTLEERFHAGVLAGLKEETPQSHDIPGEGSAFIVLRRHEPKKHPAHAHAPQVCGIAYDGVRPDASPKLDAQVLTSLTWEALSEADVNVEEVEQLFSFGSYEEALKLAWSLTMKEIWGNGAPAVGTKGRLRFHDVNAVKAESGHKAPTLFRLSPVLGDLGAATFPMNLAIAGSQFLKTEPSVNVALVLDQTLLLPRGVVCLKKGQDKLPS